MKRIILITIALTAGILCRAQGIKSGPWVCDARENTVTILWTSDVPGMGYVELADGARIYDTFAGRRTFHRLHSVRIDGLKAGSVLEYRIGGENLKDDSNARKPVFEGGYESAWNHVKTLDSKASACRFSVFNDVHMRTAKYEALAAGVDSSACDFIFLNGDIVSAGNFVLDTLVKYAIDPLGSLPAGIPLFFGRGNHEGRGNNVELFADVFPNEDPAPFYYTFRQGPVAFIVFDAGETGKSRSILFSGADVYEDYLQEQIEWATKAVKEPLFRKAPVKVCILHVPMIDHPDQSDYLLQRWLNRHIVPILNKAGVDLMIGADLHEFMMCEAGTMGADFPIIVNNEARRLDFEYERKNITVRCFHPSGALEFQRTFHIK